MTSETIATLTLAAAAVLIVAMLCATALAVWKGWLSYQRLRLQSAPANLATDLAAGGTVYAAENSDMSNVIEIASVKERLRRLEAIANGVEL